MKTINAKGGASPNPVMMAKAEVDRGETELKVLLDNPISASDVMRFFENSGFSVQLEDDDGTIAISARKSGQPMKLTAFKKQPVSPTDDTQDTPSPQIAAIPVPEPSGSFSVLITRLALGNDLLLGEILMKSFLATLAQMEHQPLAVILMNEGVKLALYDSSSCDHLKSLENSGASILICAASANHFNVMDQVGAGSISNIHEIIETLNKAGKILTL